jgi:transposase-like protein
MTPFELSHPVYHDEDAARAHLEALQWPNGPVCPYCGSLGEKVRPLAGDSMGKGWHYCGECREKFTVRVGTVYERSHIPLHKWLLAFRLYAASKKGFSAHQLHRTLAITYKSAWFMAHRIREAMRDDDPAPLGGKDKTVEVDETFIGPARDVFVNDRGWVKERGTHTKRKVVSLVEKGVHGGRARSVKVEDLSVETIGKVLTANIDPLSTIHTDEAQHYKRPGRKFAKHESVNHSEGEYARKGATTNTVEGFFSIFKRGMVGVYQHCGEQHLQRYLDEFDFRYSNRVALGVDDAERTDRAIKRATGKRLTYRQPRGRRTQAAEPKATPLT